MCVFDVNMILWHPLEIELRSCVVQVMQRVTDGLLVPVGSPKKIISKVELKLCALQLPPLDAGHPPPSTVLLEHAS